MIREFSRWELVHVQLLDDAPVLAATIKELTHVLDQDLAAQGMVRLGDVIHQVIEQQQVEGQTMFHDDWPELDNVRVLMVSAEAGPLKT